MKKCINGKIAELTPEEITTMQSEIRKAELMEKSRPMTEAEVSRLLITRQINTLEVDGSTALRMKEFYPTFDGIVGQTVGKGFKFTHGDKLWQVIQQSLTIQSHYAPGVGTESLYAEIVETHAGTEDDPIPYSGNIVLVMGNHYIQNGVIYMCNRDTVNPVYNALSDLVGLYVEIV